MHTQHWSYGVDYERRLQYGERKKYVAGQELKAGYGRPVVRKGDETLWLENIAGTYLLRSHTTPREDWPTTFEVSE